MRAFMHVLLLPLAVSILLLATVAQAKPVIAAADFDFLDTSGEAADQSQAHQQRLVAFSRYLREQLTAGGIRLAALSCTSSRCTATDPGFETITAIARRAGASHVVIGIIRKTSTLIGWVEYSVLDVTDNRSVCGELITYRDDTDESWRRAARFLAGQIASRCDLQVKGK